MYQEFSENPLRCSRTRLGHKAARPAVFPKTPFLIQSGFTLIELLVVVALMAIVAAVAVMSLDKTRDTAEIDATKFEMAEIRKAILQFRRDVRDFPADLGQLVVCHDTDVTADGVTECGSWDPDTHRGWNGPYMSNVGDGLVTIGADFNDNGTGSPTSGAASQISSMADSFIYKPAGVYFEWESCSGCGVRSAWGRPYLIADFVDDASTTTVDERDYARIISMGPDGVYDSAGNAAATDDAQCRPQNDDIVLCLMR